jgi:DNA topoisomerase-1
MTSLLIVESPAKCSKIQGFLGPGWKVIATFGHIRALEESIDAVGINRDFEPKYTFINKMKSYYQHLAVYFVLLIAASNQVSL